MTDNEIKVLRANIIGGMDTYIREVIGDDDITEAWLAYGLPDGTTEEDLMEEMEDEEMFEIYIGVFKNCLYANRNK